MKKKKKSPKSKIINSLRFPTLVGLVALVGFFLGLHFLGQQFIWTSRAGAEAQPREVKITNIDADSFTVSWQTEKLALGGVKINLGDDQELTLLDIRGEQSLEEGQYYTHYVAINDLTSDREYQFLINSNGREYGQENKENGRPWVVKTALLATGISPEVKLAYGQVVDEQGEAVAGALVYLDIPQLAPLSSLTSDSGYWMVPFAFAYGSDLSVLADYQEGLVEEIILVEAGSLGRSVVSNITRNNKPVPPITLGQDSDFRDLNGIEQSLDQEGGQGGQFPLDPGDYEAAGKQFTIINPEEDEGVATFKPEIFGTVPFEGTVEVVVESETVYQGEAQVDENGFWRYSPPGSLEPGEHTVTAIFTNSSGEKQTLVRSFVVLAAEDDVAFTATPSGEQTSPTPTNIPTVVPVSTATPTIAEVSATPTLTPVATATPAGTTISPSPTGIPQTGFSIFSNLGLWVGGVILLAGGFLTLLL